MSNRTGFIWHETFFWHEQGKYSGLMPGVYPVQPGRHYEDPEGKRRIKNLMDASGYTKKLVEIEPRAASDTEILRAHTQRYLEQLKRDDLLPGAIAGPDSPFTQGSFTIARLAAGAVIEAVDAVFAGTVENAWVLTRPPGHHAESDIGKGLCLINNAAIAAHHALATKGIKRIAFVDMDVHHGNGAEEIFWRDPRVLTISVHQEKWFPPDTGMLESQGEGEGEGLNLNVPLPAGCGWGAYEAALDQVVLPALDIFKPELIIVPFGLDAGAQDPLGRMILSSNHMRAIAAKLKAAAEKHCEGRMVITHEGGYNNATTPFMGIAVVEGLSGVDSGVVDPYGVIMDNMFGHELLAHQSQAVKAAKDLLVNLQNAVDNQNNI